MPGSNSAQRLLDITARAPSLPQDQPAIKALSRLFDYQPIDPAREHARRLEAALTQLDATEQGLRAARIPDELFGDQFRFARIAFSPDVLGQMAPHLTSHLNGEVRLALRWAAHVLPPDSETVAGTSPANLAAQVRALLAETELANLPHDLREFIELHLRAILEAIELHAITGAVPLARVFTTFAVQVVANKDVLDQAVKQATPETKSTLKKVADCLKQGSEIIGSVTKGAEGLGKAWELAKTIGPQALELGQTVLAQLPAP